MSTPVLAAPPPGQTTRTATPSEFLTRCARTLLVPVAGLAGLLAGWALITPALVTGWPAATAHLTAWVGPAAVLAPLASLGWLLPAGLVLWGPASALFAIALAAVHRPALVGHAGRARTPAGQEPPVRRGVGTGEGWMFWLRWNRLSGS